MSIDQLAETLNGEDLGQGLIALLRLNRIAEEIALAEAARQMPRPGGGDRRLDPALGDYIDSLADGSRQERVTQALVGYVRRLPESVEADVPTELAPPPRRRTLWGIPDPHRLRHRRLRPGAPTSTHVTLTQVEVSSLAANVVAQLAVSDEVKQGAMAALVQLLPKEHRLPAGHLLMLVRSGSISEEALAAIALTMHRQSPLSAEQLKQFLRALPEAEELHSAAMRSVLSVDPESSTRAQRWLLMESHPDRETRAELLALAVKHATGAAFPGQQRGMLFPYAVIRSAHRYTGLLSEAQIDELEQAILHTDRYQAAVCLWLLASGTQDQSLLQFLASNRSKLVERWTDPAYYRRSETQEELVNHLHDLLLIHLLLGPEKDEQSLARLRQFVGEAARRANDLRRLQYEADALRFAKAHVNMTVARAMLHRANGWPRETVLTGMMEQANRQDAAYVRIPLLVESHVPAEYAYGLAFGLGRWLPGTGEPNAEILARMEAIEESRIGVRADLLLAIDYSGSNWGREKLLRYFDEAAKDARALTEVLSRLSTSARPVADPELQKRVRALLALKSQQGVRNAALTHARIHWYVLGDEQAAIEHLTATPQWEALWAEDSRHVWAPAIDLLLDIDPQHELLDNFEAHLSRSTQGAAAYAAWVLAARRNAEPGDVPLESFRQAIRRCREFPWLMASFGKGGAGMKPYADQLRQQAVVATLADFAIKEKSVPHEPDVAALMAFLGALDRIDSDAAWRN